MPLPHDYAIQQCSLARALEVVGERWTLLIVRDAFFGVRRFGDFAHHLRIPRAVLAQRLETLVAHGVLGPVRGSHGHEEYVLTAKGLSLWPVVRGLLTWGDSYCSSRGPLRVFRHVADDGEVEPDGTCAACSTAVSATDLVVTPGPGLVPPGPDDEITAALAGTRRLLDPIRA
jgi:DNA-binding HxlR family transcriptional regulator